MKNFIVNPFFYYSISFTVVLIFYTFGWSDLYLPLSKELTFFIFFTVAVSFFVMLFYNKIISSIRRVKIQPVEKKKVKYLLCFLTFSLILECMYHGLIPIFLVVKGINYDYTEFGIPVFHVFLLSYVTILGIIYFYRFLIYRDKYYLSIFFFSIIFSLIIVNRGTLIFILVAAIISYASLNINFSKVFKILITFALVMGVFGVLGNLRMISSGYKDDNAILKIGQASESFLKTGLPSEVFWTYLYITSPYANLENEMVKRKINSKHDIETYLNYEILPDFISKRTNFKDGKSNLLTDELNVSTMYGASVNKMGIIGAGGLFFWYIISILLTPLLINRQYFIPTIISLSTLSCFLMFDNILTFSGFVFQFFILICFSHFKFKQITLL